MTLLHQWPAPLGLLALALSSLALVDAGTRIGRRLLGTAPLAVLVAGAAVASTWLLVMLSMLLLFFGLYRPWFTTPAALLVAAVARLACGPGGAPFAWFLGVADAVRQVVTGPRRLLLLLVLGAIAGQAARGVLLPPLSWDSLTYHLTIAARWVQDGAYSAMPFPDALWDYGHYPNHGELMTGWLLLPFHGDLLVNLVSFPFLLLAGGATYALARELGARGGDGLLMAAVVMCSPPLFAYVTSQYVDLQITAEALAAALFLVRALRTGAAGDFSLAAAALGLAMGTKQSALALAAVGSAVLAVVAFRRRAWLPFLGALPVMLTAGLPWYLRNAIETGNPLFPFGVSVGGRELLAGSTYRTAALQQLPDLSESTFLHRLLIYAPNALSDDLALTFGPKLPLLALGGILGLVLLWRERRAAAVLLAVLVAVEVLAVAAPGAKTIRDRWPEVTHRFFATSTALLAATATLVLARAGRSTANAARVLLAGLLVWDLSMMNKSVSGQWSLGAVTALTILAAMLAVPSLLRHRRRAWLLTLALLLAALAAVPLQTHRDRTRYRAYAQARDVHAIPRACVPGWESMDDPERPRTIAFASGWDLPGHHWLVYPLFGRRLQNRVLHVPPVASEGTWSYARATWTTDGAGFAQRLRDAGADHLFSVPPWPPELAAVETSPQAFGLREGTAGYRIHDVR